MAVAASLTDEILRAFVNSHEHEMTLTDLFDALPMRMRRTTTDDILDLLRSSDLVNLFSVEARSNDRYVIQLSPKLTLCEACLRKGCRNRTNCPKLHLCRIRHHFSDKPLDKPCSFPHRLSDHSNNVVLLRRHHYDRLTEDLLLDLLRFHHATDHEQSQATSLMKSSQPTSSIQLDRYRSNDTLSSVRTPTNLKKSPILSPVSKENTLERQLDISIPSKQAAPDIDLEIVQLLLETKDFLVERTLPKQISNEYYRRFTLQFGSKQVIDSILKTEPIIVYNDVPIKMKRTVRKRDDKIFALNFGANQKIDSTRLNLYIETLVGKLNSHIFDMTSGEAKEQIYLIRCEQPIDFEHLHRAHAGRNTLQGSSVTILEVYETESLAVSFLHDSSRSSMTVARLEQLFGKTRWRRDVFACVCDRDLNNADIELMDAQVTAQWLSEASRIERDLSLNIHPIIDFIQPTDKNPHEDDEEVTHLLSSSTLSSAVSSPNLFDDIQKSKSDSHVYYIRPAWRMVLTHTVFSEEYQKYIREHLNIPVRIMRSSIRVPNEHIRKELARYTNMFIQTFVFQELSDLDRFQVKLIKENYSRMAHKWNKDTNKTLIAARRDVSNELFPLLSSASRQQNPTQPTPLMNLEQPSSPKRQEKPVESYDRLIAPSPKSTEDDCATISYPIANSVYLPFFSPSNPFRDRLTNYLLNKFNVNLEIQSISSTKITLQLKGPQKTVHDARTAITGLFQSLKMKTYTDADDVFKFAIPDIYHVAQWTLDQSDVVSSCSSSGKTRGTLTVRYFANNPQFGVDEQTIDDIVHHTLFTRSYEASSISPKLETNLAEVEQKIRLRPNYGQDICCFYDDQKDSTHRHRSLSLHLCGLKPIVQQLYEEMKKIGDECKPIPCQLRLLSNQVNFLLQICPTELSKIEQSYKIDGVDILARLKTDGASEFLAPKYLHEKIKLSLLELCQLQMISKSFDCLVPLTDNKRRELNNTALRNRCLLAINSTAQSTTSSSRSMPGASVAHAGTIRVSLGDLTTEQCEVLVVCSTSDRLCSIMIKAAGPQVEQELNGKDLKHIVIDTSAGQLKQAKRLLFVPWTPPSALKNQQDLKGLRSSISTFIQYAFKYAAEGKFKSIAFPAVGCGGYGIPAELMAATLIDSARELLDSNPNLNLIIKFVVQQQDIYSVFDSRLTPQSTRNGTARARSPSSSHSEKVDISLTTNNSNIEVAKRLIITMGNDLARSSAN